MSNVIVTDKEKYETMKNSASKKIRTATMVLPTSSSSSFAPLTHLILLLLLFFKKSENCTVTSLTKL